MVNANPAGLLDPSRRAEVKPTPPDFSPRPESGEFSVSYLQSLQEPEGPKPATTRNQTESGIVQHFPIIIPTRRGGTISKRRPVRSGGRNEHLWVHTCMKLPRATQEIRWLAGSSHVPWVQRGCCTRESECELSRGTKQLGSFASST